MKVRLVRLRSIHKRLRTNEVEGECQALPEVGRIFTMTAPPLDPTCAYREIWTTRVKTIRWLPNKSKAVFETKNSTYRLEMMD